MPDDLSEKLERLCERFGVPEPWRSLVLGRFEDGGARYGKWNHLAMRPRELAKERGEEAADLLAFLLFFPWSRAYHSTLIDGKVIGMNEEDADEAVDSDAVDGLLDVLRLIDGGENGQPAHAR